METSSAAALSLLVAVLAACGAQGVEGPCQGVPASEAFLGSPELEIDTAQLSPGNLKAWAELLAAPRLDGRHAGDPGARAVAALLAGRMAALGLEAPYPGGGYCQGFPLWESEESNVVGHLSGPPSDDGRRVVLVSAHYDGQGRHPTGGPLPGADDNASGVAALLEVARVARRVTQAVDWVFAAFGGEETGQLGSKAYLAAPTVDLGRVALAVNLDMVGRPFSPEAPAALGYLVLGARRGATLETLRRAAAGSDVELRGLGDLGAEATTDAHVLAARTPAVLLSTGLHADHHELTDTPERLDYAQIERATRLVLALGDAVAASAYNPPPP